MFALVALATGVELGACFVLVCIGLGLWVRHERNRPLTSSERHEEERERELASLKERPDRLSWADAFDAIDWREITALKEEHATRERLEREMEKRLKGSRASVHYLPHAKEWTWEIDDKDAA